MLRRTEPVLSLVPRFLGRVQSKRAAASTPWTGRFARKSVDAAIASSRSAHHVIAATPIARPRAAKVHAVTPSARHASVIGAVPKAALIIAITSARTGRA
jgi:hypothetical protein